MQFSLNLSKYLNMFYFYKQSLLLNFSHLLTLFLFKTQKEKVRGCILRAH